MSKKIRKSEKVTKDRREGQSLLLGENRELRELDPNWIFPVPPSMRMVGVRRVEWVDGATLRWVFDSAVVGVGSDAAAALEVSVDGVNWYGGTGCPPPDEDGSLRVYYDPDAPTLPEVCYVRVLGVPEGLTFAQGRMAVPVMAVVGGGVGGGTGAMAA
jgi:hypothetical protein